MKLKTLEEIDNEADDSYCTCGSYQGLIRKEAIKHIKESEKLRAGISYDTEIEHAIPSGCCIRWIKHFFNITESDLK